MYFFVFFSSLCLSATAPRWINIYIIVRAKQRSALIWRCFYTKDPTLLIKAFTVYVSPLLEYCCSVWSPYLMYLINCIECVQRNFTKKLKGIGNLSYDDTLKILNIDGLEIGRIKFDLVLYYKIIISSIWTHTTFLNFQILSPGSSILIQNKTFKKL